MTKVWGKR